MSVPGEDPGLTVPAFSRLPVMVPLPDRVSPAWTASELLREPDKKVPNTEPADRLRAPNWYGSDR